MGLKARYEPDVDRMRLVYHPEGSEPKVYWVMRRQWLGLLFQLRLAARKMEVALIPPVPIKTPRSRPQKDQVTEELVATVLDGFRVRVEGDICRLVLIDDKKGHSFGMKAPGLLRLEEMVALQAERAGWDPAAALQRLQASVSARAAMRQAKR
jgi:hypothetical protein